MTWSLWALESSLVTERVGLEQAGPGVPSRPRGVGLQQDQGLLLHSVRLFCLLCKLSFEKGFFSLEGKLF